MTNSLDHKNLSFWITFRCSFEVLVRVILSCSLMIITIRTIKFITIHPKMEKKRIITITPFLTFKSDKKDKL